MLDERVHFLKGWFADTLPQAGFENLSLLYADGDMYDSTRDILVHAYAKLSKGGALVVDDYLAFADCQLATDEFRQAQGIYEPLHTIGCDGIYWYHC